MQETPTPNPVLRQLKDELCKLYGARLERVLLYGSRARGDHNAESDYDLLVVLKPPFDHWKELGRLAQLSAQTAVETAGTAILSLRPATAAQIEERTGFMYNVRREALTI